MYTERRVIPSLINIEGNLSPLSVPRPSAWLQKNCNADRMNWTISKFKMSTVKFPNVQFACDGIGLQFSRQCLMGYIHHYWVIASSSRVLRQRKRGMVGEEWTGMKGGNREIKGAQTKKKLMKLLASMWKCDIRGGVPMLLKRRGERTCCHSDKLSGGWWRWVRGLTRLCLWRKRYPLFFPSH